MRDPFDGFNNDGDDEELKAELERENDKRRRADEFARMLDESMGTAQKGQKGQRGGAGKKISPGDKVRGEILVVGKEEIFVSIGQGSGKTQDGIVPRRDLLDKEGNFTHKRGDVIDLFVTQVRGSEVYLSPKATAKNLADDLGEAYQMRLAVEGRVTEVVKGGFRVALMGNKLAFCPVSQIDSKFVETPDEYIGRKLDFRITQFSEGGRNIVVSRRMLLDEQRGLNQETFSQEHKEGSIVLGKITRIEKFGAFVELVPGVEGLAHVSELSWSRVADPHEAVSIGQDAQFKILKYERDGDRLRISLSLKQAEGEPWEKLPSQVAPGQVVEGKVTRCMPFGAFVELAPGLEGLVPLGEMSHTRRVMRSDKLMKEGERVLVMIKGVDPNTRRISLSLRDAGEDPWSLVAHKYPVGAIIKGRVERREPYGLFIRVEEGITGLLPKSKANDRPEFPFDKLKVGDEATVQIGELRIEERRISLDVPKDPGSDDWKGFVGTAQSGGGFGLLADKLKSALEKKDTKKK